jgi:hypothetical protein
MDDLFMQILSPTPEPVSSDYQLTEQEADDMVSDDDALLIFAASIYPHVLWN